jgi:transposase
MGKQSKYDEAFQKNAVGLVLGGRKASVVARDLGLRVELLYQWVKRYRPVVVSSPGSAGNAEQELERLRSENALLRMERDILKKAVGIFSLPPR